MKKNIKSADGQSVIEIIIALAIFSLIASAITTLIIGSFSTYSRSEEIAIADNLADEAIEAVEAVRDRDWNELSMSEAVVDSSSGRWTVADSPGELIGDKFQRTIFFSPVYRDAADNIVSATTTDAVADAHSKWVKTRVEWTADNSSVLRAERTLLLTFWDYDEWTQNDWIGGAGQAAWSEPNKYFSDDGNIDMSVANSLALLGASSTFPGLGEMISSAFDTGAQSNFTSIAVKAEAPEECGPACFIKVQIKTAPTEAELASASWRGPAGTSDDNDYYASSTGMQINPAHNGDSWMMYKVVLISDTVYTPVLKEISIGYKKK